MQENEYYENCERQLQQAKNRYAQINGYLEQLDNQISKLEEEKSSLYGIILFYEKELSRKWYFDSPVETTPTIFYPHLNFHWKYIYPL